MNPSEMTDEELTRAVAERVMGWHQDYGSNPGTPPIWLTSKNEVTGFYVSCKSVYKAGWSKKIQDLMWDPLHDLNHAWMVVERMVELGWILFISPEPNYTFPQYEKYKIVYEAGFYHPERQKQVQQKTTHSKVISELKHIPHVILEAALEAVGGKNENS